MLFELYMKNLHSLISLPQSRTQLLEVLRLPEIHVRLHTWPPNERLERRSFFPIFPLPNSLMLYLLLNTPGARNSLNLFRGL